MEPANQQPSGLRQTPSATEELSRVARNSGSARERPHRQVTTHLPVPVGSFRLLRQYCAPMVRRQRLNVTWSGTTGRKNQFVVVPG